MGSSLRTGARRAALYGMLAGIVTALQVAMSFLPNIEPVTLLIMVYSMVFGREALYIAATFVLLEGFVFGFGLWWFSYLYIWPLWALLARLIPRQSPAPVWAAAGGAFGLSFGALCALPYLLAGGWGAAVSYWISGIPFDLAHCGGNFILILTLGKPLYRLLSRLRPPG